MFNQCLHARVQMSTCSETATSSSIPVRPGIVDLASQVQRPRAMMLQVGEKAIASNKPRAAHNTEHVA